MQINKFNLIFVIYLVLFVADSILNFFIDIPVFASSLIVLPFLFLFIRNKSNKTIFNLFILSTPFIISYIVNAFRFGFSVVSLSDLLFIISFFIAYLFYNSANFKNTDKIITYFLLVCTFLLLSSYFGFDKNVWGNTLNLESEDLEFKRSYRQGFFRKSHIAAYFFYFLLLYYLSKFKRNDLVKIKNIVLLLFIIFLLLITGSRTPFVIFIISLVIYYFKPKYLYYFFGIIILIFLLILNIDWVLSISEGSILFQYLTLFKTLLSNFSRLSRVIIWVSWIQEVRQFSLIDFIIGRGFMNSIAANFKNVGTPIWFHNDFLSIIYTYGIIPVIFYTRCFIYIYKTNKERIKSNLFIFAAFTSTFLSGFFNGFYYYFPIILMYIFYGILNNSGVKKQSFL